jgi:glucokinase
MQDPVVLTLDAGGTNFVFSALKGTSELTDPIRLASNADHKEKCIATVISGFEQLIEMIDEKPAAISFAFPGPSDYERGIIGDLPNFPSFRGGVPLGPILEKHFKMPVFINNDGDLYAYGEALMGYLPWLNNELKARGSVKTFRNLIGLTLGTGFGAGIVVKDVLLRGDNSCGAEIHNAANRDNPKWNAEESISTRAIQRVYADTAGLDFDGSLMPKDIYDIAKGEKTGNPEAAREAFRVYGQNLGHAIANIVTFVDGIIILGGGIVASWDLFSEALFAELDSTIENFRGEPAPKLSYRVYNLEDESIMDEFAKGKGKILQIPGSDETVEYDSLARVGVGVTKLGASKAISLGAYAFAVQGLGRS